MKKMTEIRGFLHEAHPSKTFLHALQKFIHKRIKSGLSDYSIIHLYNTLHPMGLALGNPVLSTLSPQDTKAYADTLWIKYAPGTIRPMVGDIKQFFRWCKKGGYSRNISKRLTKPRPRHAKSKAAVEADVQAVVSYLANQLRESNLVFKGFFSQLEAAPVTSWTSADKQIIRDLFMVAFLYETGARAGELANLGTRAMLTLCQVRDDTYSITSTGKTNDRTYRFTHQTAELWRIWQLVRPAGNDDYAITGWRHEHKTSPMNTSAISRMLVRRCRELQLKPFRAHALRHAKIQRSRRAVGLELASQLVDHSSIITTIGYDEYKDDELKTATIKTGLQYDVWEPSA